MGETQCGEMVDLSSLFSEFIPTEFDRNGQISLRICFSVQ